MKSLESWLDSLPFGIGLPVCLLLMIVCGALYISLIALFWACVTVACFSGTMGCAKDLWGISINIKDPEIMWILIFWGIMAIPITICVNLGKYRRR